MRLQDKMLWCCKSAGGPAEHVLSRAFRLLQRAMSQLVPQQSMQLYNRQSVLTQLGLTYCQACCIVPLGMCHASPNSGTPSNLCKMSSCGHSVRLLCCRQAQGLALPSVALQLVHSLPPSAKGGV